MPQKPKIFIVVLVFIILILVVIMLIMVNFHKKSISGTEPLATPSAIEKATSPSTSPSVLYTPLPALTIASKIVIPIDQFKQRITKKSFGTYVTPTNSPVSPEKFTGFHTGVDVEYGDVTGDVPVFAIAEGKILSAQTVSGYGGAIALLSTINGSSYVVIYGHLDPKSLIKAKTVKAGDQIAILGDAYSNETDEERKHLHFAIVKGIATNWLGYVQSKNALESWIDPLTLF